MSTDMIIIGDAHVRPDISNERFNWLGKFIADYVISNPHTNVKIIDMGDFEDMPSLSSYDLGKLDFEGRRYQKDIEAAIDARAKLLAPLTKEIFKAKENKKKQPKNFELYALGGNHFEGRINRILQEQPWLVGKLSVSDGLANAFGFKYIPFGSTINLNGIMFTHYWKNRGSHHPIGGGKNPAATIQREKLCSSVTGHSHVLDRTSQVTGTGKKIFTLVAGCFLAEEQTEKYAGQANDAWWKGICVLKDVRDGYPTGGEQYITIQELKRMYYE